MEISLCMIVKNEEKTLATCLDSIHDLVDEINIVDTGSTDRTVEIAKKYTDRIFFFEWINDFGAARNFSFSKATKDYIMWLDADDIIYEKDRQKFIKLKETMEPDVDYIVTPYVGNYDEMGKPVNVANRERIVKRKNNFKWEGVLHESIEFAGKGIFNDLQITHNHLYSDEAYIDKSLRNFDILNQKFLSGGELSNKDIYYYALMLNGMERCEESNEWFEKFISTLPEGRAPFYDVYTTMHKNYIAIGDYEKAFLTLHNVESHYNNRSEYYCTLGDFFKDTLKDAETAINYYNKAIKCEGNTISGQLNIAFYYEIPYQNLGACYLSLKDYKSALENYKKALEYKPVDSDLRNLVEKLEKIAKLV
ncbi:glycosyltransferase [Tyzzerella sp. OttesenSCG-928-J15]|nr:glycosyltransferase [Tyzzerella sp. OttesenSCG-928-J15]